MTRTARTTLRGHLAAAELVAELEQLSRTVKDPDEEGPADESTLSFEGTERWQATGARGEG